MICAGNQSPKYPSLAIENSQVEVVLARGIRELYRIDGLAQGTKIKLLSIRGALFDKSAVYDVSPLAG